MGKDLNRHLSKRHIQIAKIIQKCTTRKSRIKIMRYPTTPISSAKFQIYDNIKCWRVRSNRNPPSLLVGCMYSHTVRQLCGFFFFFFFPKLKKSHLGIQQSSFQCLLDCFENTSPSSNKDAIMHCITIHNS